MQNETLILAGEGYELSIAPEAETEKATLLEHSTLIVEVNDPTAAEAAKNQIKKLAAMRNLVEKSRKTVKEPVLQVGRDIDAKAKGFLAELRVEEKRITGLVGDYAVEVERARREELRKMEEQRRKEEFERRAAEEARLKAEREAAEAKRKAEQALWEGDDSATKEAEEKARIAAEEASRAAAEEQERAEQATVHTPIAAPVAGVKMEYDFEVSDIDELYRFNPSLVRMEANRSEVLAAIKRAAADGAEPVVPGIRIFEKAKVGTR